MTEFKINGKIEQIKDVQKGQSKDGKQWQKQEFVVKTDDKYNNTYCFEVFGEEKVANLTKFNKVGDDVTVAFNINTNEWKDKHFTSLSAWRIEKDNGGLPPVPEGNDKVYKGGEGDDDLPPFLR